ncbi:MAG: DUF4170 domain-containing protein [Tsuneonella suprasediminis]|uniref:DUF4170 domain-containing protein n=1 Tax=Tsuneonella suprasediminis TaxID=2306996 RepID=A0A419R086_9SPHN|nr:DUF4170 domain-containing protein [Tsuneonella suprasediminis]RJX66912.1 DUF4170 domain-containing protein [Tsuneonella suprasediminis]UBS32271.1 DUF4170 domain-containing protein [Altererythrobacter sp. N1]
MSQGTTSKQLLHLVMGGRVTDPRTLEFENPEEIDVVGVFPSYTAAVDAWRGAAQRTVDDAEMKYVIVHLHKLLDPEAEGV